MCVPCVFAVRLSCWGSCKFWPVLRPRPTPRRPVLPLLNSPPRRPCMSADTRVYRMALDCWACALDVPKSLNMSGASQRFKMSVNLGASFAKLDILCYGSSSIKWFFFFFSPNFVHFARMSFNQPCGTPVLSYLAAHLENIWIVLMSLSCHSWKGCYQVMSEVLM